MADLLGSVFGSGQSTNQKTTPDATSQAMNQEKLNQLRQLFARGNVGQFADPSGAYATDPAVQDVINYAMGGEQASPMTLGDYGSIGNTMIEQGRQSALGTTEAVTQRGLDEGRRNLGIAQEDIDRARTRSLDRAGSDYALGRDVNRQALDIANANNVRGLSTGQDINRAGFETGRAVNKAGLDTGRALSRSALDLGLDQAGISGDEALASLYGSYDKAYGDTLDTTSNYISKIATPQIQQQMALQGLEGSGAVNASISRATAEAGMPLMQQLISALLGGTTDIAGRQQATEGGLSDRYLGGEQALGSQYLSGEQDVAGRLQSAEAGLAGQYLTGLQGATDRFAAGEQELSSDYLGATTGINLQGMDALKSLLGNFQTGQNALSQGNQAAQANIQNNAMDLGANFATTLPGAAETLGLLPSRERAIRSQAAAGLMPIADWNRDLRQQDLTRRQDLFTTAYTGIPFTSGGTQKQDTNSKPLFNLFGMG